MKKGLLETYIPEKYWRDEPRKVRAYWDIQFPKKVLSFCRNVSGAHAALRLAVFKSGVDGLCQEFSRRTKNIKVHLAEKNHKGFKTKYCIQVVKLSPVSEGVRNAKQCDAELAKPIDPSMMEKEYSLPGTYKPTSAMAQAASSGGTEQSPTSVANIMPLLTKENPKATTLPAPPFEGNDRDNITATREEIGAVIRGYKPGPVEVSSGYAKSIISSHKLGEGFFGTVYEGHDRVLGLRLAVKTINKKILEGAQPEEIEAARKTFVKEQRVSLGMGGFTQELELFGGFWNPDTLYT